MYGGRSFQLKQGDLVIGDGLKAGEINVSLDAGNLTVAGRIDASGIEVGAIRLAARHGLTIGGQAVLDAHGTDCAWTAVARSSTAPTAPSWN